MLEKMLKILSENYKKYLPFAFIAYIPTLIASIFFKSDHIIISTLMFTFAYFCGLWFVDIRESIHSTYGVDTTFWQSFKPSIVFFLLFLIISVLAKIFFGYAYGIVRMIFCFIIAVFVGSSFKKSTKS